MNDNVPFPIAPEERGMAAITHLSGLAGYIVPLGGVVVPVVILLVKSDSKTISGIARQALLLNVAVFLLTILLVLLGLTIILIPFAVLAGIVLAVAAVALPVVGAVKASEGVFFRYPVVGSYPR